MGWDYTHNCTKRDLVANIKRAIGKNLVTSKVVGQEFWVVEEQAPGKRQIVLFLLAKGGPDYGYKDMTEAMGPFYYKCPLAFLDLAPEQNAGWRAGVRTYHAQQAAAAAAQVGHRVRLTERFRSAEFILVGTHGRMFLGQKLGEQRHYRIPRQAIAEVLAG